MILSSTSSPSKNIWRLSVHYVFSFLFIVIKTPLFCLNQLYSKRTVVMQKKKITLVQRYWYCVTQTVNTHLANAE